MLSGGSYGNAEATSDTGTFSFFLAFSIELIQNLYIYATISSRLIKWS